MFSTVNGAPLHTEKNVKSQINNPSSIYESGVIVEWLEGLCYGAEGGWKVISSNPGFAIRQLENFLCHHCAK